MIDIILAISKSIKDGRTPQKMLGKVMEEIGELAVEVNIKEGYLPKSKGGEDGVIGEAADAIISLVDIVYLYHPDITEAEFEQIIANKLKKWIKL